MSPGVHLTGALGSARRALDGSSERITDTPINLALGLVVVGLKTIVFH